MNTQLLLIDPQNDFCDPTSGALYVAGAEHDIARLTALTARLGDTLAAIHVTLDTHHTHDIAHPLWWVDASDNHPAPFTIIAAGDVAEGRWRASDPAVQARSAAYVTALAKNGRYPLCVWPYHCLQGSVGAAVVPVLHRGLTAWEQATGKSVGYYVKGMNPFTEHYSAIQADVPDPSDPATLPNRALLDALATADRILVGGEAGSHCVASTVRDLVDCGIPAAKLVLLTDGFAPVPGFEALQTQFLSDLAAAGATLITTTGVH